MHLFSCFTFCSLSLWFLIVLLSVQYASEHWWSESLRRLTRLNAMAVPFKRFCEMKIGIISQCMVKPRQLNDQYIGNLALKINLKVRAVFAPKEMNVFENLYIWVCSWFDILLARYYITRTLYYAQMGGFNSPLSSRMTTVLGESTIIFGMDVSHGSPGDVNVPSIAAVVATKNWPDVFHYSTQVRTQPAKTEMIEGLFEPGGGMVKYVLQRRYLYPLNSTMF